MLQNTIRLWLNGLHFIINTLPYCYTTCIIIAPRTYIVSGIDLGKPFRKIPPKTIHFIFSQPMFYHTVNKIFGSQRLMIKIVTNIEWMFCRFIEPWIICRRLIECTIKIHLHHWRTATGMIQGNIHNDGYSPFVAFIYKLFQHSFCTINLIRCQIKGRIITPTIVTVKFIEWHDLYRIYTQFFQIVK